MKFGLSLLWLVVIGLIFLTGYFAFPTLSLVTSSAGTFTVLNDTVYLNWTNGYLYGVIINSTVDNNTITITNDTSHLTANYSQPNSISPSCTGSYNLYVADATTGNYVTNTSILNTADTTTMNLIDFNPYSAGGTVGQSCAPGRYLTTAFLFKNYTNSSENATITVIVDIPISSNNTLSVSTRTGSFGGSLPAFNASIYHSYFFNTSAIPNATAIALRISGWPSTQTADLFLMNGNNMLAKSINQNTTNYLIYNFVPAAQMWEARIYGNSTSSIPYTGYIVYTTLNVSNASDTNQQISQIDFGSLDASGINSVNLSLNNAGNISLSNVATSSNTHRTVRFGGSGSKNFNFIVGNSSVDSAIHVSLNWTGAANYTLNLYNPSGILVTTSSNYYKNANASSVNQELFNDTSSITQGFWNVSVVANSGTDPYNVTVFIYTPLTWISSNYTTTSFYPFTTNVTQINITVPNTTIDGTYEGQIFFTDSNNARIVIPYNASITAPTLVIQNITAIPTFLNPFGSGTYRIDEDYNSTVTRTFNVNLINLGSYDLIVNITNSSGLLTCYSGSCSGYTANLTLNSITNVASLGSQIISFNVSFNYSNPQGTYDGWIFINATNNTNALSSHPYSTYNLTVRLALTNYLFVQIPNILSNNGDNIARNISSGENVTAIINVSYINATLGNEYGPQIQNLPLTNFTSVWLQEKNVTPLGRIPSSGSLALTSGTSPLFFGSYYNVNFTVPANSPGGNYEVHTTVSYLRPTDLVSFSGEGINSSTLIINNTGLFMSSNTNGLCSYDSTCSASTSINPNGTITVNAKVANYGPLTATGATINITTSCNGYTISAGSSSGCGSASYSNPIWTLTVPAYNTSCIVSWILTAGSSSAGAPNCAAAYLMGGGGTWFDPSGINLTVTVTNVTTSTTSSSANSNLPGSSAAVYVSITNYTSLINIVQGSTNSTIVFVKNINTSTTQDIGLSITNLTSSWYSISPTIRTAVAVLTTTNFTVTFAIPNNTAVADYNAKFVASSNYGNDTKNFTVRVLPSNNTKTLINDTYQLYKLNYTNLYAEVNKSKTSGKNTTLVESELVLIKAKLDLVQIYINSGDYFMAQQTLNEVKALLEQAYSDYKNITSNILSNTLSNIFNIFHGNLLYIVIGGVAIAAVIIGYLFWPTKEGPKTVLFKPKIGEKSPEGGAWQKLKEKWSWLKLRKKWGTST